MSSFIPFKRKKTEPEENNSSSSTDSDHETLRKRVADHVQVISADDRVLSEEDTNQQSQDNVFCDDTRGIPNSCGVVSEIKSYYSNSYDQTEDSLLMQADTQPQDDVSHDMNTREDHSLSGRSIPWRQSSCSNFYDKDEDSLQMRVNTHLQDIAARKHAEDDSSCSLPNVHDDNSCTNDVNLQFALNLETKSPHRVSHSLPFLGFKANSFEDGESLLNTIDGQLQHVESVMAKGLITRREERDLDAILKNTLYEDHSNDHQSSQQNECTHESEISEHDNSSLMRNIIEHEQHYAEQGRTRDCDKNVGLEQDQNLTRSYEKNQPSQSGDVCDDSQEILFDNPENLVFHQLFSSPSDSEQHSSSESSFESNFSSSSQDSLADASDIESDILQSEDSDISIMCFEKPEDSNSNIDENLGPCVSHINAALALAAEWNNVKLFDGSSHSVNEGILLVMDLWIRNRESKSSLDRTLKTISKLLPKPNNLPSTAHRILSFVEGLAPDLSVTKHFFCKSCGMFLLSDDPCPICCADEENEGSVLSIKLEVGHFYILDIENIVRYWFEERNLSTLMIECRRNSDGGAYSDIQDGSIYKALNKESSVYDINLVLGIDGVAIRKASCKECWLVMTFPVEVPLHLRKSFTTVVGIWYDEKKPKNMNAFMRPLCEKIVKINEDHGLSWNHPDTKLTKKSEIKVSLIVADAPARAKVQNMKNHNAINGCNICEISSVKCNPIPGKRGKRAFKYKHNVTLRNKNTMQLQARQATESGKAVKGVKGYSIFSIIPNFDISSCCFPEFMHSVLLGVTKQMIKLWIGKPGAFNIKNRIPAIDDALSNIRHPDFVHRTRRTFTHLSAWKASDYYYFLLYEALPVLEEFLHEQFYQHLILLVRSVYQLLKRNVYQTDINEADLLLRLFVRNFGALYGDRSMTYNVHQLCHLALSVERFGPLHCNSAFPFEGMNGTIAKATHGTNLVSEEIVNNLRIYHGVQRLERISKGLDSNLPHNSELCPGIVLGRCRETEVSPEETILLGSCTVQAYSRAKIGLDVYTSEVHKTLKTANYYVMWKCNNVTNFGSIRYFLKNQNVFHVCVRMLRIDHLKVIYHHQVQKSVTHLLPFEPTENFSLIHDENVLCTFVKVGRVKNFLFVRPNLLRSVL